MHLDRLAIKALIIITILCSFGTGMVVGSRIEKQAGLAYASTQNPTGTSTMDKMDMTPFWKAAETLDEKFVATTASSSAPTNEEKVYGAIQGLAAAYGDPFTTFFPPKESKDFNDEVRGNFGGIGAEIGIKDDYISVIAPLKNTPSEKAGLKPGDLILAVNKKSTLHMPVEEAISLIRGPQGTTVTLTVKQNGTTKDITIERDTIEIPTIDTELRNDGVFVISLYNFSSNSPALFHGALREFVLSGADKLVLDLRNNPGGYLDAAIDMASFFLPTGKTIVIEDSGDKAPQKMHRSFGYDIFNDNLKMAVLINGGSASASEILAGALHENGVAKLIGEKSYGKGSVQELVEITSDTTLKVTIAKWLTPNRHSISQNGLEPDITVKNTKEDAAKQIDTQLEKAADILKDPSFKR